MKNVYTRPGAKSLLTAVMLVVFWGCTTVEETPPQWIRGGEALTEGQFLAYGRAGTVGEAREHAQADAAAQISQILVRDLEAQNVTVTREVGHAIEERAAGRVESQNPVEHYRRRDAQGAVEQYLLYEYLAEARSQDLSRIYEVVRREIPIEDEAAPLTPSQDPSIPEEEPPSALREVRTRLSASVPESAPERRQYLETTQQIAGDIDIMIEPQQRTIALGDTLSSSFSVVARTATPEYPLVGVALRVEISGPEVDGRRTTTELQIRTNQDGTAQIPVATPEVAGTTQILVEPAWLAEEIRPWRTAAEGSAVQDLVSSIAERVRARAAVQVTSQAASVPTAMIVLDRDIAGNPIGSSDTMRGMAQEFAETDFRIHEVDLSSSNRRRLAETESISVADLYDILPFDVLSQTERVIVGHTQILEFTEDDGFTVVVAVEAAAFDLRRDEVLARVSFQERITGSDARSAIRTAFQAAGRRLVRRIVPRLP